jgi:hypothetical protein
MSTDAGARSASTIAAARVCKMSFRSSAKVLTPIVEVRKAVPSQDSFAGPIPFPRHRPAQSGPESRTLPDSAITIRCRRNLDRQIPFGRVRFHRVMAADEIERTDQTAVATAIAQAAFGPPFAVAEELQQQIEGSDGFGGVASAHDDTSGSADAASLSSAGVIIPTF